MQELVRLLLPISACTCMCMRCFHQCQTVAELVHVQAMHCAA